MLGSALNGGRIVLSSKETVVGGCRLGFFARRRHCKLAGTSGPPTPDRVGSQGEAPEVLKGSQRMFRKFSILCAVAWIPSLASAAEAIIWVEGEQAVKRQLVDNPGLNDVNPDELSGGKWICSFSHEHEPTGTGEYMVEIPTGRRLSLLGPCRGRHGVELPPRRRERGRGRGYSQGARRDSHRRRRQPVLSPASRLV